MGKDKVEMMEAYKTKVAEDMNEELSSLKTLIDQKVFFFEKSPNFNVIII